MLNNISHCLPSIFHFTNEGTHPRDVEYKMFYVTPYTNGNARAKKLDVLASMVYTIPFPLFLKPILHLCMSKKNGGI